MTINNSLATTATSSSNVHTQSSASSMSSAEDFSAVMSSLVSSLDTNQNSGINTSEFQKAVDSKSSLTSDTSSNTDQLFSTLDSNKDGLISSDEFLSALQQSQSSNGSTSSTTSTDQTSSADIESELLQKILASYGNSESTSNGSSNLLSSILTA